MALALLGFLAIVFLTGIVVAAVILSAALWLGLRLFSRSTPASPDRFEEKSAPVIEATYQVVEDHERDESR